MRVLLYVSLIDMSKGDLHVWRTWFFVFFETMDPWFQTDDAKAAHSELCENKKPGRTYCARFEIAEGFSERQLELFMISNEAIDDFLPSVCVLGHLRQLSICRYVTPVLASHPDHSSIVSRAFWSLLDSSSLLSRLCNQLNCLHLLTCDSRLSLETERWLNLVYLPALVLHKSPLMIKR